MYSTNYQVDWDNKYIGDMTAVTTHGQANASIYAVGSMGTHFIDIYEGYPGAAYMNPAQHPSLQELGSAIHTLSDNVQDYF